MDKEDVKELLAQVERVAQCPVCLEVVRSPVVQCVNGHVTCGQCKNNARSCNVCRGPFSETSTRVLEEVLSLLPKPCPHYHCEAVTLLENHSKFCVYRQIKCAMLKCRWSGNVQNWLIHVNSNHALCKATYQLRVTECLRFRDFLGSWKSQCYYHKVGNLHFLSNVWKTGNKFYHTFRHIRCEKSNDQYGVIVSYRCGPELLYKTLIEVLPYEDDESMEKNAAVFPLKELNGLVDESHHLSVFVKAITLEKL